MSLTDNLGHKPRPKSTPDKGRGGGQRGGGRGQNRPQSGRPASMGGMGMRGPLMGSGPMSLMDMGRGGMGKLSVLKISFVCSAKP